MVNSLGSQRIAGRRTPTSNDVLPSWAWGENRIESSIQDVQLCQCQPSSVEAPSTRRRLVICNMQIHQARLSETLTKLDEIDPMGKVDERVTISLNLGDTLVAMSLIA